MEKQAGPGPPGLSCPQSHAGTLAATFHTQPRTDQGDHRVVITRSPSGCGRAGLLSPDCGPAPWGSLGSATPELLLGWGQVGGGPSSCTTGTIAALPTDLGAWRGGRHGRGGRIGNQKGSKRSGPEGAEPGWGRSAGPGPNLPPSAWAPRASPATWKSRGHTDGGRGPIAARGAAAAPGPRAQRAQTGTERR